MKAIPLDFFLRLKSGLKKQALTIEEQGFIDCLLRDGLIKNNKIFRLSSNFLIGQLYCTKFSDLVFFESLENTKERFKIDNRKIANAKNGDIVIIKKISKYYNKHKASHFTVQYIIQRQSQYFLALVLDDSISLQNKKRCIVDFDTQVAVQIQASKQEIANLAHHSVLKVDIDSRQIIEHLGNLADARIDEKIVLAQYGFDASFDHILEQEIIHQARQDPVNVDQETHRMDLRHLDFITIDPKTAKDFDDAIYFHKPSHTLFVAIADVSHFIKIGSRSDQVAFMRGFSLYFPHKSIPMLHPSFSEKLCSLRPNEDKLVFVCEMQMDMQKYKVKKYYFYEAIICSKMRYDYDYIDKLLVSGSQSNLDKRILKFLKPLNELCQAIRVKRMNKGYEFITEETNLRLGEDLRLLETWQESSTASHQLIEECMLLANKMASTLFEKGIFRTHESPSLKNQSNLLENLAQIGIYPNKNHILRALIKNAQVIANELDIRSIADQHIIQSLKKAKYSYENIGHFALGFSNYTHFTSPIRRYADLILHHLMKAILAKKEEEIKVISKFLYFNCAVISHKERVSNQIMFAYKDRVYARWAAVNLQRQFKAQIIKSLDDSRCLLELKDKIQGANLYANNFNHNFNLFDTVLVVLESVDLISSCITVKIIKVCDDD